MFAVMFEFANRVAERSPPLKSTSTASALAMFNTLSVRALISSREYIGLKRIADDVSDSSRGSVLGARRSALGAREAAVVLGLSLKQKPGAVSAAPAAAAEHARARLRAWGWGPTRTNKCWLVSSKQTVAENDKPATVGSECNHRLVQICAAAAGTGSASAHLWRRLRASCRGAHHTGAGQLFREVRTLAGRAGGRAIGGHERLELTVALAADVLEDRHVLS